MSRTTLLLVGGAALALAAVGWFLEISPDRRVAALLRVAPAIPPSTARHLIHDDEPAFRSFCRRSGTAALREMLGGLRAGLDVRSAESLARTRVRIGPAYLRVARGLAEIFHCPEYLREFEYVSALPPLRGLAAERLCRRSAALRNRTDLAPAVRVAALDSLIDATRACGLWREEMLLELEAAREVMKFGRAPERMVRLQRVCAIGRASGETNLLCQALGELGASYDVRNRPDSVAACYDEALAIASRCRLTEQAARITQFYAIHYANQGRLVLATDLLMEAQRICRETGDRGIELRFTVRAMDFFAAQECWEIVSRLLERCPVLIREMEHSAEHPNPELALEVDELRAMVLIGRGEMDSARSIFNRVHAAGPDSRRRVTYAGRLDRWTAALVQSGREAEALPLIEEGLTYCDSVHVPEHGTALALRRAQVMAALGRTTDAGEALADVDRRLHGDPAGRERLAIERDVLEARLLAARGRRGQALSRLARAHQALRREARGLEPGAQAYLALAAHEDLRRATHDIAGFDAEAGYRYELTWRSLANEIGRSRAAGSRSPGKRAGARFAFEGGIPLSRGGASSRRPAGVWHCVYLVGAEHIVRWTAGKDGIQRDTLGLDRDRCRDLVAQAVRWIERASAGPANEVLDPPPPALRELGRELLPTVVHAARAGDRVPLLAVSPDGPLCELPFEALDLAERGDYVPLARRMDVVTVRSEASSTCGDSTGSTVVVADPRPSPEVLRRYPFLARLGHAGDEARAALRAWPRAHVLSGVRATKAAVLAAWPGATRLYVAAHLVRDPETPFREFLPLSMPPAGGRASDAYLELADVRALDLSRCRLAVLSACASGAPLPASPRAGPSLGDIVLDSGAHAVVQTRWPIRDDDACVMMEAFLLELLRHGSDPARALGAARRGMMAGSGGLRGQGAWAAWSVEMRGDPFGPHARTEARTARPAWPQGYAPGRAGPSARTPRARAARSLPFLPPAPSSAGHPRRGR